VAITLVLFVALVAFIAAVVYATKTSLDTPTTTHMMSNPTIDIESARTPTITVTGVLKPTY
jgi:hypothetical protein